MPFTVAHAVVAPPLRRLSRGRLPVAALAVGAMSPDFEYLVFLDASRKSGHTPAGLFTVCLPISLAVLWAWHRVVKLPLADLLPGRWAHLRSAVGPPHAFGSLSGFAATCLGVLVGGVTHLGWDSLAHHESPLVRHFAPLHAVVPGLHIAVYVAVQYASSVVGLGLIAAMIARWARRQSPPPTAARNAGRLRPHQLAVLFMLGASTFVAALLNTLRVTPAGRGMTLRAAAVAGTLGGMAGGALAVALYGTVATLRSSTAD